MPENARCAGPNASGASFTFTPASQQQHEPGKWRQLSQKIEFCMLELAWARLGQNHQRRRALHGTQEFSRLGR
jgi:hypothetical protein